MSEDNAKSLWDSFRPKAKLIGGFAKHCIDHQKERAELIKFVEKMVEDLKENEEESNENRYQFRVRKFSIKPEPKSRDTNKDVEYTFTKDGHDEYCFICQKQFTPFTKDLYPCRVCTRAFHKKCLQSCGECNKRDEDAIERCHTNTGWSCYMCADLSRLLTDEEMKTLIETFDDLDVDRGVYDIADSKLNIKSILSITNTFISLEEFIKYKNKTVHLSSTDVGKQQIISQFAAIDFDKDGRLKWWEFVGHEAKLLMAKRSTDSLLDLLTEKEIVHAKAVFSRMDDDKDGLITHTKALTAYKNWYMRFEGSDTSALDLHADVAARIVMGHDTSNTGTVSWGEFLSGQALYIICARPNI